MRRSDTDPDLWEIYVSARNYGTQPRNVTLRSISALPARPAAWRPASQRLTLPPGAEKEASFEYRTRAAGHARRHADAARRLSRRRSCRAGTALAAEPAVTVYSNEPDLLRPVLSATPRVTPSIASRKSTGADDQGLVILDRFIPPQRPAADSIWIDPPAQGSPIPVRKTWSRPRSSTGIRRIRRPPVCAPRISSWTRPSVFEAGAGDGQIGEVEAGPVIVARAGQAQNRGVRLPSRALGDALRAGDAAAVRQPAALDRARDLPPLGDHRRQRGRGQAGDGPGRRRRRQ